MYSKFVLFDDWVKLTKLIMFIILYVIFSSMKIISLFKCRKKNKFKMNNNRSFLCDGFSDVKFNLFKNFFSEISSN